MVKKKLIIIGGGAFGHEVRDLAAGIEHEEGSSCPWRLFGFLDDRKDKVIKGLIPLGSPHHYSPAADEVFVCAIGEPKYRALYAGILRARGASFAVLREPSSKIGNQTRLDDGSLIGPFCVVSCRVALGQDSFLTAHVTVGHDVSIGSCCHISAHTFLGGGVTIRDGVCIFPHACILPGITVGEGAVIGAGSVVMRPVMAYETVFGIPAMAVVK